jgi:ribose 5-phosphate isomerase A
MIKGGGGALTREKIIANSAAQFICLVDESKLVKRLGKFPVAVEVIPLARSLVGREMIKLGGQPIYREHTLTDNNNIILDGYNFDLTDPPQLENALNQIPGVVENGIFARRLADQVLVAYAEGDVRCLQI